MKNKSVKLPFVTKNSKHLVETGADDLLALIEFTPLWKTSVKLPFETKKISRYICMQQDKTIVTYTYYCKR